MEKVKVFVLPIVLIACAVILFFFQIDMEKFSFSDGPYLLNQSNEKLTVLNYIQSNDSGKTTVEANLDEINSNKILSYLFPKSFKETDTIVKINRSNEYKRVTQIFALGDVHGEYSGLLKLLQNNKIIDRELNWIFGTGHLVFCGDVFDRGASVTECLWLIYKLDQQAIRQGGRVHYVLGNHEVMILNGDIRYIHKKYRNNQRISYINYSSLFNKSSILGKWIRQQNSVVKINDNIFVHGGLSPEILKNEASIDSINLCLNNYLKDGTINELTMTLLSSKGPLWYRGYLQENKDYTKVQEKEIDLLLEKYKVDRIIFAHTQVEHITPLYKGKLIAIDVALSDNNAEALLIKDSILHHVDIEGNSKKI
ncbi:MAG: metallophosphoesterase [Nitrosopumilaceae archaeon]|nr:metallophosphoesterase [Nitrosopumilaceae archaeon]